MFGVSYAGTPTFLTLHTQFLKKLAKKGGDNMLSIEYFLYILFKVCKEKVPDIEFLELLFK